MNRTLLSSALAMEAILIAVAALAALAVVGKACALAVVAAGAASFLDLLVILLAIGKLAGGPVRGRLFYSIALGVKFPVLIAAVYLMVVVLALDTLGLIIGFSTLVLTILYASFRYQRMLGEDVRQ